jgi:VIT1/CCC1 family predicted Fe2+/Mn2+ transporter
MNFNEIDAPNTFRPSTACSRTHHGEAFIASIVLTIIVLAGIGIVRGRLAKISLFISSLEVVAVGAVSGLGGYFLGVWFPKLLGY